MRAQYSTVPTHQNHNATTPQHATRNTRLLRTVIANSAVECILGAKTVQLHLIGVDWWGDLTKSGKLPSP